MSIIAYSHKCGIHVSVGEVLQSVGSEIGRYPDIAHAVFENFSMYVP